MIPNDPLNMVPEIERYADVLSKTQAGNSRRNLRKCLDLPRRIFAYDFRHYYHNLISEFITPELSEERILRKVSKENSISRRSIRDMLSNPNLITIRVDQADLVLRRASDNLYEQRKEYIETHGVRLQPRFGNLRDRYKACACLIDLGFYRVQKVNYILDYVQGPNIDFKTKDFVSADTVRKLLQDYMLRNPHIDFAKIDAKANLYSGITEWIYSYEGIVEVNYDLAVHIGKALIGLPIQTLEFSRFLHAGGAINGNMAYSFPDPPNERFLTEYIYNKNYELLDINKGK
jgi:hypothetical protein